MIDIDQVRKVASLARLELSEAEEQQFTTQLNSILDYVQQLDELDTQDVPPTTRAIEVSNITRPDRLETFAAVKIFSTAPPIVKRTFSKCPRLWQARNSAASSSTPKNSIKQQPRQRLYLCRGCCFMR
jgi:aspartyl-tRNA(Asn)/glutamyl-tRNA(Gln) amidotransferase subunit C